MGLIFTELMTYASPLRGDDLTQLAFASMNPTVRPTPRAFGVPTSDALEAVLLRALAVSPEERFRTMGELWSALSGALGMPTSRAFLDAPASSPRLGGTFDERAAVSQPGSVPQVSGWGAQSTATAMAATAAQPTAPSAYGPRPSASFSPAFSGALPPPASGIGGARLALIGIGSLVALGVGIAGIVSYVLHDPDKAVDQEGDASAPSPVVVAPEPPRPTCPEGMTEIAGGKFFRGSDDPRDEEHERPAHQVTLSPYCIDTTEVTVAQYKACSDRGECKRAPQENRWEGIDARSKKLYDPLCNIREPEERADHPINCIDWELADAYCRAVGKRLPTEAEWEFATRGSDGRRYPWGDEPPMTGDFLNACGTECVAWGKRNPDPYYPLEAMYEADDGFPTTAPVGSFPKGASPFGVKDVVGNVWEWVADWYAPYGSEPLVDPKGPDEGEERVLRGGAWNGADAAWVRPTFRFKTVPTLRSHGIGVRCAKTL